MRPKCVTVMVVLKVNQKRGLNPSLLHVFIFLSLRTNHRIANDQWTIVTLNPQAVVWMSSFHSPSTLSPISQISFAHSKSG